MFVIHKHKFVAVIIVILQLMVTLNDHISATIGPLTEISASEFNSFRCLQAERGFAAWAVFVGRTVVFVRGKGKGA